MTTVPSNFDDLRSVTELPINCKLLQNDVFLNRMANLHFKPVHIRGSYYFVLSDS